MIANKQMIERFLRFEKEHGLFEIEVQKIQVWPLVRRQVFSGISRSESNTTSLDKQSKAVRWYAKAGYSFLKNLVIKNPFFREPTSIVFITNGRRKLVDGVFHDIFFDPLHNHLGGKSVMMERNWNLNHPTPTPSQNIDYLDVITHGGHLLQASGYRRPKFSTSDLKTMQKMRDMIAQEYESEFNMVQMISEIVHERNTTLSGFQALFSRVDPDLVVLHNAYHQHTVVEASHSVSIPVVELQHGVIDQQHLGYNFPPEVPVRQYPDYLLIWGEYWRDSMTPPLPADRIFTVGYPWLEQNLNRQHNHQRTNQIVFISQSFIGEEMSKFAIECANDQRITDDIIYKLHPKELDGWKTRYPWLHESRISVVGNQSSSLYELFAQSRAQVGVASTSIYEGLCFDLDTYIYNIDGADRLMPLVDDGVAQLIDSTRDLTKEQAHDLNSFNREHYFKEDALENTCSVLKELEQTASVCKPNA